jgi:O-antigen/teichoic acid export membrane protein
MSVKKSLMWTAAGQIVLFSSQMASQIIIARLLNPYLVGIAAIAFTITDLINIMQTFGLRNFLVSEESLSEERIHCTFTINLLLSLVTSLLVLGVAYGGAAVYSEPGIGRALQITALIPVVMALELTPSALMQRDMKFAALASASAAKALVTAGTTVALVLLGFSYMSIAYGALAGALVSAVVTNVLGRHDMRWGISFHDWRSITKFGIHMFGVGGINTVSVRLAELAIGRMLGLTNLAIYSRASALNNLLWTNIHTVFTKVVFSAMAEDRRRTGSIRSVYLKTMDMVTATLWPAFAGLAVFAGPVVYALYGEKWLMAAPVLSIFAVAAIGATSITMTWEVFVVCGMTGEQMRIETLRSIGTLLCTIVGATIGLTGAAFGRVGDVFIANLLYRRPLFRYTETRLDELTKIYQRSAVLTVSAVLPGLAIMTMRSWDPRLGFLGLIAGVAAGISCWVVAVCLLHKELFAEIGGMLSAFRRRGPTPAGRSRE